VITATRSKRGSAKFDPADGPGGRRKLLALVVQNGRPRVNLVVGSYRAPGPRRPGKPRHLRIRRRGTKLVISWAASRWVPPRRIREARQRQGTGAGAGREQAV